jgi:hypothetical protein
MSSTKSGPIINDNAEPVKLPAIKSAVDVVRWLLGNQVADKSTPPDNGIGAVMQLNVCPKHINIVETVQFPPVGIHLNTEPKN